MLDIDVIQLSLAFALLLTAGLMFANSSVMIPPSEFVCLLAGYWAAQNGQSWLLFAFVASIANLLGTAPWFHLGVHHQRKSIERSDAIPSEPWAARLFRQFTRRELAEVKPYFSDSGGLFVLVLRLVPLVRSIISYAAGRFGLDNRTFYLCSYVGIQVWCGLWVWSGYHYGLEPNQAAVARILVIFGFGFVLLWLFRLFIIRKGEVS